MTAERLWLSCKNTSPSPEDVLDLAAGRNITFSSFFKGDGTNLNRIIVKTVIKT